MHVVLMPDRMAQKEHYASTLPIVQVHRFWCRIYEWLGHPEWKYEVIRGWSRPLYRIKPEAYIAGDTMYIAQSAWAMLKLQTQASPGLWSVV